MVWKKRGQILVVLVLLLGVFAPFSQAAGCILYPGNEDLYCVENAGAAGEACSDDPNCPSTTRTEACAQVQECQLVTCAAPAGCEYNIPRGLCGNDNVVADEQRCIQPVCCTVQKRDGQTLCDFVPNYYACQSLSQREGGPTAMPLESSPGLDLNSCLASCGAPQDEARLTLTVTDAAGGAISSATIQVESAASQTTDSSGQAVFSLEPGFYDLTITAVGFQAAIRHISLRSGQQLTETVILQPVGEPGSIAGTVYAEPAGSQITVERATVTISGDISLEVSTDANGFYSIANIPPGRYTLLASHPDYGTAQTVRTISEAEDLPQVDFTLRAAAFTGVSGIVFLNTIPVPGAKIFLDGNYVRQSRDDGRYEIPLPQDGSPYLVQASYAGIYTSQEESLIMDSPVVSKILLLRKVPSNCTGSWPNVGSFSAIPVQGRLDVVVQWTEVDCTEPHYYQITVTGPDGTTRPPVSYYPPVTSFTDHNLQAGGIYTYTIVAVYQWGDRSYSSSPLTVSVQLGNAACLGVPIGTERCPEEDASPDTPISFCNEFGQLQETDRACDPSVGEYCAEVTDTTVSCKSDALCAVGGNPLGLYYDENICYYGTASTTVFAGPPSGPPLNFCVYDQTPVRVDKKATVVDVCHSCTAISSCFSYKSKAACEKNSCLANDECLWVDAASMATPELVDYSRLLSTLGLGGHQLTAITAETGQGYCVEEKYPVDDQCIRCDPTSPLFENALCTPDVCTSLGRCFTESSDVDPPLSSCSECGASPSAEATCYTYTSELECTRGTPISQTNNVIGLANDSCGWGRCAWIGDICVKDGNVDNGDDCSGLAEAASQQHCRVDNTPPITVLLGKPFPLVSLVAPNLTFEANDELHPAVGQRSLVSQLFSCLLPVQTPEACSLLSQEYPHDRRKDNVSINIIERLTARTLPAGQPYLLRFFSEDQYFNRESAREAVIFVDNVPPEFTINETIIVDDDKVILKAWLMDQNEPMSCQFQVHQPESAVPLVPAINTSKDSVHSARFEFQGMAWAVLEVSCTDVAGNTYGQTKEYTFDLEENINITSPAKEGYVSSTDISFVVSTTVDAECALQRTSTGEEISPFIWQDSSPQRHQTAAIPGFTPGEYFQEYKVVCTTLTGDRTFEDHFHFTVDLTPPTTSITLTEGERVFTPTARFWETSFIASAEVQFSCDAEGFSCNGTYYCVSSPDDLTSCPPFPSAAYQLFSGELTITESSRICYYSTDAGNSFVYSADCGTILVEGYGITLQNAYTNLDEKWVISAEPIFDWGFSTKIPTRECRFDFAPEFDYNDVLDVQILFPQSDGAYAVRNFPQNVFKSYPAAGGLLTAYVKCLGFDGSISPELKVNLEYDPEAPTILEAYADPDTIFSERRTHLFDVTDKKTLCKYSDNSEGTGSTEFATMEYAFPGLSERILKTAHEDIFALNNFFSPTGTKAYSLATQCRTGAELLSEVEEIRFVVDYTSAGYISNVSPNQPFIAENDVILQVDTSRPADCSYMLNDTFQPFAEDGATVHRSSLQDLADGNYQIPVHCEMEGGHTVDSVISFTVDTVSPTITSIEDGNYTCGGSSVTILAYSSDAVISGYYFEVYDRGEAAPTNSTRIPTPANASSNTSNATSLNSGSGSGSLVRNTTVVSTQPLSYSTEGLLAGHRYVTKVWLVDGAGNQGASKETNGIIVVAANNSVCARDQGAPKILPIMNTTICTETEVELRCADVVGCQNISYGQHAAKANCLANRTYQGQKLHFPQSGWICYSVRDYAGNNLSETISVTFTDGDGDGIADSCDTCLKTASGRAVGNNGCSFGEDPEGSEDKDGDGLPDFWEKIYDGFDCSLSFASPDSDQDGESDAQEDYDKDESSNYEEYLGNTDPCLTGDTPPRPPLPPQPLPPPQPRPLPEKESILALVLFLVGLLLTLGGTGYLVYFYQHQQAPFRKRGPSSSSLGGTPLPPSVKQPLAKKSEQQEVQFQKGRSQRQKARAREGLFGAFNKVSPNSLELPHIGPLLQSGKSSLEHLEKVAKTYAEHQEEIKPLLGSEEKGIFSKLARLAKQAEHRDVKDLVKPAEAKDLFSQLKDIARRRKP